MPLPDAIRKDPYYPLAPGCLWVYRDASRRSYVRTTIRAVDPLGDDQCWITTDTLFTASDTRVVEQLAVRESGIYVHHHGAWHGPDPILPLSAGREWTVGPDSAYPVRTTVSGPVPVKLEFGHLTECLRVDQVGEDGTRVRTEWYAPDIGLARWIDHWEDHNDLYELVYFSCARTGRARGFWPRELAAA